MTAREKGTSSIKGQCDRGGRFQSRRSEGDLRSQVLLDGDERTEQIFESLISITAIKVEQAESIASPGFQVASLLFIEIWS
jgi:hypothetical protein